MNELDNIADTIADVTETDKELLFRKFYRHTPEAQPIKWMFAAYCYQQGYDMNDLKDYLGFKYPQSLYTYRSRHFEELGNNKYRKQFEQVKSALQV